MAPDINCVLCDLFDFILISAFCWFLKNRKRKKMHGVNNIKFKKTPMNCVVLCIELCCYMY